MTKPLPSQDLFDGQSEFAPAHEILGAALALKGEVGQGLQELQRAVAIDPKQSSAITKIGDIYYAQKKIPEAKAQFLNAIKITPEDRRAHQRLGLIYEQEGKADLAIAHFEKGIAGTPPDYLGSRSTLAGCTIVPGSSIRR